jgi:hypothetical protein
MDPMSEQTSRINAKAIKFAFLVLLGSLLSHCTTVKSISLNQIPERQHRRHKIQASAEGMIILTIPTEINFAEKARSSLMAQCQGGAIEGVLAKDYFTTGFPPLLAWQGVHLQCRKSDGKALFLNERSFEHPHPI